MRPEFRLILAIVLSSAFFIGYSRWLASRAPQVTPTATTTSTPTTLAAASPQGAAAPRPLAETPSASRAPLPRLPSLPPEKITVVEGPWFVARFSSHGARLKSWELKRFHETVKKNAPRVKLAAEEDAAATLEILGLAPERLVYEMQAVERGADFWRAIFTTTVGDLRIEKIFTLMPEAAENKAYQIAVGLKLVNLSEAPITVTPVLSWQAAPKDVKTSGFLAKISGPPDQRLPVYAAGGKSHHFTKWDEKVAVPPGVSWLGLEERYFLAALIARRSGEAVSGRLVRQPQAGAQDQLAAALSYGEILVPPLGTENIEFAVYLGPKDINFLQAVGVGLEQAIDFGWFGAISRPLLFLMQGFHHVLKNWGLAIIALTILVKLATYPLSKKSMQSMKAMQALQPQLAKLREKYKNDRQKLNLEMMQLFRTHKVNPASGCLPLVIQTPIYIALYKVLYNAIELYHAPFFVFYRDLAAPDPYFIFPVLTTAMMVLQQALTPNPSADPAQQTVMKIMPIMFGVVMVVLPVGLVLYIFVNMLLTVVQQYMNTHDIRLRDLPKFFMRRTAA